MEGRCRRDIIAFLVYDSEEKMSQLFKNWWQKLAVVVGINFTTVCYALILKQQGSSNGS